MTEPKDKSTFQAWLDEHKEDDCVFAWPETPARFVIFDEAASIPHHAWVQNPPVPTGEPL